MQGGLHSAQTMAKGVQKLASSHRDLFKNVLIVRKTPKYQRLKDSEFIKHPYIQDVLLQNW